MKTQQTLQIKKGLNQRAARVKVSTCIHTEKKINQI